MRIVMANGVFDILHRGHIEHLLEAREMGGQLIVALTVDEAVNKGPNRPFNTWEDRALLLRQLRCVDAVIPSYGAISAIENVRPQIFVKGIDYSKGENFTEDVAECCKRLGVKLRYTTSNKRSVKEIIEKVNGH